MTEYVPICEVCGHDGSYSRLTMEFSRHDEMTVRCEACEKLIRAGLLRIEYDEERRKRYRAWHFQPMIPGELLPPVERA